MGNFKEVLLVVNPISGDISKDDMIEKVEEKVREVSADFHLYKTTGDDDKGHIKEIIKKQNIDHVIVAGGDGTINLVAESVQDLDIGIGILPAGSANGLALNLDIPKAFDEQLEIAFSDKFIEMDILCLNDIICLHMGDLGLNAELIRNYEESTIRGKFGYLLQSIPTLIKSEFPFHFKIKTDKIEREEKAILLGIANANKYGTGANVNPEGRLNDGVFEILIFRKLNFMQILKTLRNEADLDPEVIEIIHAKEAKIKCHKPEAFQTDGEYLGKVTEVEIKILPNKLKIAVPENYHGFSSESTGI